MSVTGFVNKADVGVVVGGGLPLGEELPRRLTLERRFGVGTVLGWAR